MKLCTLISMAGLCALGDRLNTCEMGGDVWGNKGCIWGFGGEAGGKETAWKS